MGPDASLRCPESPRSQPLSGLVSPRGEAVAPGGGAAMEAVKVPGLQSVPSLPSHPFVLSVICVVFF